MKSFLFTFSSLFFLLFTFVYCGKRLDDPVEISWESGDITANRTLSGKVYFEGIVQVTNNSILTIQPGTELIFRSDVPSVLVIDQGSQINAVGTPNQPITFTSDKTASGAWGGIIITGRAPVVTEQLSIPANTTIIPGFAYGGANVTDNSGQLKYVRILYAGGITTENLEAPSVFNGLTLCGVGNSTIIDYVQVHKSARDAFAMFGGTVNLRHIIATSSKDDGLYGNETWNGSVQFFIAQMTNRTVGNGIELENQRTSEFDNKWTDESNLCFPFRGPDFVNVTIVGNESDRDAPNHAVFLKPGSHGSFVNLITAGFETSKPIRIETGAITTHFYIHYSSFQFSNSSNQTIDVPNTSFDEQQILTTFNYYNELTGYKLKAESFSSMSPDFSSTNYITGLSVNYNSNCPDSFLIREVGAYDFRGAVGNNDATKPPTKDWTKGWTTYPE